MAGLFHYAASKAASREQVIAVDGGGGLAQSRGLRNEMLDVARWLSLNEGYVTRPYEK